MAVDLAAAKAQLNITFGTDDAQIERLIAAARSWFEAQLGYDISERYTDGVPPALDQGILLLVGHWYANREGTLVGVSAEALPFGVADIVQDFRNWSWS